MARRMIVAGLLGAGLALAGTGVAGATVTQDFPGEGSSDFGLAWFYARHDARSQAVNAGFTDPEHQCEEIWSFGNYYVATVIWRCTR
jgi:hypothetical protein